MEFELAQRGPLRIGGIEWKRVAPTMKSTARASRHANGMPRIDAERPLEALGRGEFDKVREAAFAYVDGVPL